MIPIAKRTQFRLGLGDGERERKAWAPGELELHLLGCGWDAFVNAPSESHVLQILHTDEHLGWEGRERGFLAPWV
jgi:hypothetical protein